MDPGSAAHRCALRGIRGTPQQFSDLVQAETVKFAGIIKQEGLQMDVN
jgi:hypothetical protein